MSTNEKGVDFWHAMVVGKCRAIPKKVGCGRDQDGLKTYLEVGIENP